jgi:hypothetical protein
MAFSESNRGTLLISRETSEGTIAGSPDVRVIDYNSIEGFSPQVELVARDPVSPSNQRQEGQPVGFTVDGTIQMDLTLGLLELLIEGATHSAFTGPAPRYPTSCTSAHFVVPAGTTLVERTLVMVRGCRTAANNGLKMVGAGSTATQIVISGGLVAETFTATEGVTVEVCGYRFAADDATLTVSGGVTTFGATIKNLTDFGLVAGQYVLIGSVPGTATNANRFANAANRGVARIALAPTAAAMVLDNTTGTLVTDNGATKEIDLFFGREARIRYLTDANFLIPFFRPEKSYNGLMAGPAPGYMYTTGWQINDMSIAMPEKTKATMTVSGRGIGYVGPTASRATNYNAPVKQQKRAMVNTTSNIVRGRIRRVSDGTHYTGYITAVNLRLAAPVEQNGAHGVMGSITNTAGKVMVDAEVNAHFTVPEVIEAVVGGYEVGCDWFIANGDGGVVFDIPEAKLGNAMDEMPLNQTVRINLAASAHEDSIFGTSFIVSTFPHVPLV